MGRPVHLLPEAGKFVIHTTPRTTLIAERPMFRQTVPGIDLETFGELDILRVECLDIARSYLDVGVF